MGSQFQSKRESTAFDLIAWGLWSPGKQVGRSSTPCRKRSQVRGEKVNSGQNICNRVASGGNGKNFEKQAQSSKGQRLAEALRLKKKGYFIIFMTLNQMLTFKCLLICWSHAIVFSVFKGLINLLLLSNSLVYILTNSHIQLWNILSVEESEQVSVL